MIKLQLIQIILWQCVFSKGSRKCFNSKLDHFVAFVNKKWKCDCGVFTFLIDKKEPHYKCPAQSKEYLERVINKGDKLTHCSWISITQRFYALFERIMRMNDRIRLWSSSWPQFPLHFGHSFLRYYFFCSTESRYSHYPRSSRMLLFEPPL